MRKNYQRILVIDDATSFSEKFCKLAKETVGYEVIAVQTIREGTVEMKKEPADLILLAVSSKEKDSLVLWDELQKKHPSVPIIVVTKDYDYQFMKIALDYKSAAYVTKRGGINNMLVTIERVLWRVMAEKLVQPKRKNFQTPYDSSVSSKKDADLYESE